MQRNYHPREAWIKDHQIGMLSTPFQGCQTEMYTNKSEDTRYNETNIEVDEYSLQVESGVYDILKSLDTFPVFYYSDKVPKNLYKYKFFTRDSFYFSR
jgi:hypothetical protein